MRLTRFNVSAIIMCFSLLSFPVLAVDLSGCDQEEINILKPMVEKGYWTTDD